ncbi:MAG: carboxymuconolactone decarboxylase family protein [Rhodocyclaceae bacterium]|nr:carboxymuconolactone decarboxylase family protein [Rhodocyclaceae bacterium]
MKTIPQGFEAPADERLPMLDMAEMTDAQREAAQGMIDGPRKAVIGPFIPLLRSPTLMARVGAVGETLRFGSVLPREVSEWVIAIVARHTGNQFEWAMHAPLAVEAGVAAASIDALAAGQRPAALSAEAALAYDYTHAIIARHGVDDAMYTEACRQWGEQGVVELTAMIGYFMTVCWVMNVARTPAPAVDAVAPLMPLGG